MPSGWDVKSAEQFVAFVKRQDLRGLTRDDLARLLADYNSTRQGTDRLTAREVRDYLALRRTEIRGGTRAATKEGALAKLLKTPRQR